MWLLQRGGGEVKLLCSASWMCYKVEVPRFISVSDLDCLALSQDFEEDKQLVTKRGIF